MEQLKLDFSRQITTGKKTFRLAIPCSEEFIQLLDQQAQALNTTRAALSYQFVLEGMQRTLGHIFMTEFHGSTPLRDLRVKL
jgi:hypothetical protein